MRNVMIACASLALTLVCATPRADTNVASVALKFDTLGKEQRPDALAELHCLALNVYHEARGEAEAGRLAVAAVTLNRVRDPRFPSSICEVVWQRKQFSWTHIAPRHHVITDAESWEQALVIARLFISGATISLVGDATHYHSIHVQPSWQDKSKLVAQLGDHYFYAL